MTKTLAQTAAICLTLGPVMAASPNPSQAPAVTPARLWDGFRSPTGIAVLPDGTVLVSNWGGDSVERITPRGDRTILIAGVASPAGVAADGAGNVFVSSYSGDYVVRVSRDGTRERIAEGLATPAGIALAGDGRLLIANRASGEIVSLDAATGARHVVARSLSLPVGVVEMDDGGIVATQYGGRVTRILRDGSMQELGQSFTRPGVGLLADGPDAVLAIDNGAGLVRRVTVGGETRVVAGGFEGSPVALARVPDGGLLVGAWGANAVYRVAAAK